MVAKEAHNALHYKFNKQGCEDYNLLEEILDTTIAIRKLLQLFNIHLFMGRVISPGPKVRPKFRKVWIKILGLNNELGQKN